MFPCCDFFAVTQGVEQLMFDCAHDVVGSGSERRRQDRRLRMHFRHAQFSLRMLYASLRHHSWQSQTSVGVQTDDDVLAATHAATATFAPVDAPVTSVPILHFSGEKRWNSKLCPIE